MKNDRTLTAEQVRMVDRTKLPVEVVQSGWLGATAYGDDFKSFLRDFDRRLRTIRARA